MTAPSDATATEWRGQRALRQVFSEAISAKTAWFDQLAAGYGFSALTAASASAVQGKQAVHSCSSRGG